MDAKQKYELFKSLLECNHRSMEKLANIRTVIQNETCEDGSKVVSLYLTALRDIKKMASLYCEIKGARISEHELIKEKISEVEESSRGAIHNLEMLLEFSYQDSSLMEDAIKHLSKKVEMISSRIEDPNSDKFVVSNVETVHDLIRYFHQKAIEEMFSLGAKEGESVQVKYPFFNGEHTVKMQLIDLGDGFKNSSKSLDDLVCMPLVALLAGIPPKIEKNIKNIRNKDVWSFVSQDYMDLNIQMGTHIANISALLNYQNSNFITFKFTEWCTDGRKQARMKYLGKILSNLGFVTKKEPDSIRAKLEDLGYEKAKTILKEVGRLLITTDNLDWALVNPKQEENTKVLEKSVERFMQGHYDITDFAMGINPKPYKKE